MLLFNLIPSLYKQMLFVSYNVHGLRVNGVRYPTLLTFFDTSIACLINPFIANIADKCYMSLFDAILNIRQNSLCFFSESFFCFSLRSGSKIKKLPQVIATFFFLIKQYFSKAQSANIIFFFCPFQRQSFLSIKIADRKFIFPKNHRPPPLQVK